MAMNADNPVQTTLTTYKENIKKLIEYLSEYDPDEHGFFSSLTYKINKKLAEYSDSIPDQYVPDWYNWRKAQKRGLDINSATKLGFGAGLSTDPNLACALVYLALMGIWDPEIESLSSITKKLTGSVANIPNDDPDVALSTEQLDRIEIKLDHAVSILESSNKLSKKENLTWSIVKELTKFGLQPTKANIPKIKKILETHAVGLPKEYVPEVIDIIKNDAAPMPHHWLLVSALLNHINPDGKYTAATLKNWINQGVNQDSPSSSQNKDLDK
ncbi:hypothetical protein Lepto7375DRAFT_7207 [Leptolyngbya sp. PCC 7375]|nr:hypothetical protein Lepto7375DRAFT_7207 [Leptolyngbya sp. PCC 7375]